MRALCGGEGSVEHRKRLHLGTQLPLAGPYDNVMAVKTPLILFGDIYSPFTMKNASHGQRA